MKACLKKTFKSKNRLIRLIFKINSCNLLSKNQKILNKIATHKGRTELIIIDVQLRFHSFLQHKIWQPHKNVTKIGTKNLLAMNLILKRQTLRGRLKSEGKIKMISQVKKWAAKVEWTLAEKAAKIIKIEENGQFLQIY